MADERAEELTVAAGPISPAEGRPKGKVEALKGNVQRMRGQRLLEPGADKIPELEEKIAELRAAARSTLTVFRQAMLEFAETWMQDAAKQVAVTQDEHTVTLGRQGIRDLKRAVRDHARSLEPAIAKEFLPEVYAALDEAGTGQVKRVLGRRFDQGMRRILQTVYPLLLEHGYERDDHWIDDGESGKGFSVAIELQPDIRDHIRRIAEAIMEIKVCESKILYYKRQRSKEIATALWDSV